MYIIIYRFLISYLRFHIITYFKNHSYNKLSITFV